jgi:hydroxymethylpyrimidine/phosphomethylpyrimidine kinase
MPPCILTIAGSDSSCGAGAQADIKTIAALGGYGLNAITSIVSETPGKVSMICLLDADIIEDQLRVLFDAFPIKAAKTGMLGGIEQVRAVVKGMRRGVPLVVDPVMVATSGRRLMNEDAVSVITHELFPLATLITPNLDEARVLAGRDIITREDMLACAEALSESFGCSVLVKGGHLIGDAADVLWHDGKPEWFESKRVEGVRTHGTGCSLSAAIATGLGKGLPLAAAVREAKMFVHRAIVHHHDWHGVHALNHHQQPAS